MQAFSVEEEPHVAWVELYESERYALALAVRIHQLLESSRALDLEEDLLAVLPIGPCTWLLTLRLSCSGLGAVASVIASKKRI